MGSLLDNMTKKQKKFLFSLFVLFFVFSLSSICVLYFMNLLFMFTLSFLLCLYIRMSLFLSMYHSFDYYISNQFSLFIFHLQSLSKVLSGVENYIKHPCWCVLRFELCKQTLYFDCIFSVSQ